MDDYSCELLIKINHCIETFFITSHHTTLKFKIIVIPIRLYNILIYYNDIIIVL